MRLIHLAGDSTVAGYLASTLPMSGWGVHLAGRLNLLLGRQGPADLEAVGVVNGAKNGATTQSLREEGIWPVLRDGVRPGDLALLQFGHNDQKWPDVLAPRGGYRRNLRRMATEVAEHGGRPVLCTPVCRRHFDGDTLQRTHGEYPEAVRELAAELDLPLVDLEGSTFRLLQDAGPQASLGWFSHLPPGHPLYPDGVVDDTHFSTGGALEVAGLVAEDLVPLVLQASFAHSRPAVRTPA